jgi:two-component system, NarL family, sensor histidine kinase UhpB
MNTAYTKLAVLMCMLMQVYAAVAQSKYSKQDSVRLFSHLIKADILADKSLLDSALHYSKKALIESRLLKFPRGEAHSNLKIADVLYRNADYATLGTYDSAALKIAVQLKDTFLIALSYYQLGQFFLEYEKYEPAQKLFQQSLAMYFEKKQDEITANLYNDMGHLKGETGLQDEQAEWNFKAIRLHRKNNNPSGLAQTISNQSAAYFEMKKIPEAIRYAKEAFEIRKGLSDFSALALSCNNLSQIYLAADSLQQAITYQEMGLKYAEQSGVKARIAQCYISMSLLANRQKKYSEALAYELKAIELYKTIDRSFIANRYIAAAFYSNLLGDSIKAIEYFKESETTSKELNRRDILRNVYSYMSGFYRDRKDFANAYNYYRKFIAYRDSLTSTETETKIAALQTQYETERKDFEIKRLSTEQRIKQLEIEKQKAIIAGNEAESQQKQNEIDLLSQSQQLQEERLKAQGTELEKQSLLAKNNEQKFQLAEKEKLLQQKQISNQKQLRNFLIGGLLLLSLLGYLYFNRYQLKKKLEQQKSLLAMRNSISENLHDDIGASLSNIGILNELAKRNLQNPEKSTGYLNKAGEDIQRISESISDIVWNINPKYDELKNLFVRMKRYAADMMDGKNISYELNFSEEAEALNLTMEKRRNFYLIFKEAVNNLVKYSQAQHAVIEVSAVHQHLKLFVKDDGKGFDSSIKSSGNGLHNMQKRTADINGVFKVQSTPGSGTSITLDIPIT